MLRQGGSLDTLQSSAARHSHGQSWCPAWRRSPPSCPGLRTTAPEQGGGKAQFTKYWHSSTQTNLPRVGSMVSRVSCSRKTRSRNSIEVLSEEERWSSASSPGLVWPEGREELGSRAKVDSFDEVLEQESWSRVSQWWCLHKNE